MREGSAIRLDICVNHEEIGRGPGDEIEDERGIRSVTTQPSVVCDVVVVTVTIEPYRYVESAPICVEVNADIRVVVIAVTVPGRPQPLQEGRGRDKGDLSRRQA